jgi:hypothetical protein
MDRTVEGDITVQANIVGHREQVRAATEEEVFQMMWRRWRRSPKCVEGDREPKLLRMRRHNGCKTRSTA